MNLFELLVYKLPILRAKFGCSCVTDKLAELWRVYGTLHRLVTESNLIYCL
jgi:hypothetical protein